MGFLSQNNIIAYKSIIFFEIHFRKHKDYTHLAGEGILCKEAVSFYQFSDKSQKNL